MRRTASEDRNLRRRGTQVRPHSEQGGDLLRLHPGPGQALERQARAGRNGCRRIRAAAGQQSPQARPDPIAEIRLRGSDQAAGRAEFPRGVALAERLFKDEIAQKWATGGLPANVVFDKFIEMI